LGALLVLLSSVPVYRLAENRETGMAGRVTVVTIEVQASFLWSGALVVALLGLVAGLLLRPHHWALPASKLAAAIQRPSARAGDPYPPPTALAPSPGGGA
jgi:hypothetical protein